MVGFWGVGCTLSPNFSASTPPPPPPPKKTLLLLPLMNLIFPEDLQRPEREMA